jgi:glycine cleavage system H protein
MHPATLKYSPQHFWLKQENDNHFRIGLTYHYQKQLGNIVYLELPAPGSLLVRDEPCGAIESSKASSDLISPLSGKLTEVNKALEDKPGLINKDPYGDAWLMVVDTGDCSVSTGLMSAREYLDSADQ